ncbi:DUF6375 family protein [Shewanella algidipiscicola]|uniref:Uncharacterized protein n=1 Tax=Shewanella algidipiscicola TaxID=614070 RepID=A0ABQ4P9S1_9GAMM|nr:DUF6375 family protein [Shewanella algidipiscicola]GIU44188.1 hypothetical protein TUM4630_09270 [Shewanella algidipiscicola]HDV0903494.1 hypothetical protein [Vibrio fluvialis]
MKIWQGYGAEHSLNLVIVGEFKDAEKAENFEQLVSTISSFLCSDESNFDVDADRYGDDVLEFLGKQNLFCFSPQQLAQFMYDQRLERKGSKIIISSDDDLNAFISLLIHKGAKVECFSAHDYPDLVKQED